VQEVSSSPGPSNRRPSGEFDQVGRRAAAGDLGNRLELVDRQRAGRIESDDPSPDPAPVEVDADEVADVQITQLVGR
jgi:hypothetical protein